MQRRSRVVVLCALLAAGAGGAPSSSGAPLEHEVKAEFLERFTRFIDWPPGALGADDAPFVLCTVGPDRFAGYLEKMAQGRTMKERRIALRKVAAAGELAACHLAFIAAEAPRLAELLAQTSGKPILTVADSDGFGERGVLVNFFRKDGFVRFEINLAEVKRSGLKFSSKLLKLGALIGPQVSP